VTAPLPGVPRGTLIGCLAAVWLLWGSVYLGIRLVIDEVDPFQAMAQRFLVAGLLLTIVVLVRRGPGGMRVTRRELGALVLTGVLLLGLGNGLQALGQVEGLPSGIAALVIACVPAWAVVLRAVTGDRPPLMTWVGVTVGFAGLVVLVVLGGGSSGSVPLTGVLLCAAASLCWTVGAHLQGVLRLPRDLIAIAAYQQLVAACCSALLAAATGERLSVDYSERGWVALGYLVVACSIVAFLAFAWLLSHVPLSLTATHAYVNPVVAVLLGWLVLGEPVGLPVLLGGSVVVGAVVLIVLAERPATRGTRVAVAPPPSVPAPTHGAPVTPLTPRG
jgi:drug/metabolite transporter (DMT)-like permease